LIELRVSLQNLIDEKEDDVRIYPLPQEMDVMIMGCGDRIPKGVEIFLS
jgi:hypothetical protein